MSKTIVVQNGDWAVDETGSFTYTLSGRHKVDQDTANMLLQYFDPVNQTGSQLQAIEGNMLGMGTAEQHKMKISQLVSDAIQRLMAKQDVDPYCVRDERIASFNVFVEKGERELNYVYLCSITTEAGNEPLQIIYEVQIKQKEDPNYNELSDLKALLAAH